METKAYIERSPSKRAIIIFIILWLLALAWFLMGCKSGGSNNWNVAFDKPIAFTDTKQTTSQSCTSAAAANVLFTSGFTQDADKKYRELLARHGNNIMHLEVVLMGELGKTQFQKYVRIYRRGPTSGDTYAAPYLEWAFDNGYSAVIRITIPGKNAHVLTVYDIEDDTIWFVDSEKSGKILYKADLKSFYITHVYVVKTKLTT